VTATYTALLTASASLSRRLLQTLRAILAPQEAARLSGFFRSGKRLALKKLIPFVATGGRRDSIWLRRLKPDDLDLDVVLAVDNSLSMGGEASILAETALVGVSRAVAELDSARLGVLAFGDTARLLAPLSERMWSPHAVLPSLSFDSESTDLLGALELVDESETLFGTLTAHSSKLGVLIFLGDGKSFAAKEAVLQRVRRLTSKNILVLYVALDASLLRMQSASVGASGEVTLRPYLDDFPFPYFLVLRHLETLPQLVADVLTEWITAMTNA
jgi:midasin